MKEKELISVVIPCYNRRESIMDSVKSVLSQSYEALELIVVDDASTDGTEELFKDFPDHRLRYLRYEENRGACYARNYGAERAAGELIAFQDSDDIWYTDKLEKQYEMLMEQGADLCFCGMDRVSIDGSSYYFPVHTFHPEKGLEEMLAENRAGTQTMLMHRYVWEKLRFDDSFRRYQDWDFSIRAAESFKLCYLPEALVSSEVGQDSISFRVNSYPALMKLYQKHLSLYEKYPHSQGIMQRRMGSRLMAADPQQARQHFRQSLRLCHGIYDFTCYIKTCLRKKKGGTSS